MRKRSQIGRSRRAREASAATIAAMRMASFALCAALVGFGVLCEGTYRTEGAGAVLEGTFAADGAPVVTEAM